MAFNVHRVFNNTTDQNFLSAITVDEPRKDVLRAARDECRRALRVGLGNWAQNVPRPIVLFETVLANAAPGSLRPKFRMQGSFSYATLNSPEQVPPQEIDLDDGVFLPVSFLRDRGAARPGVISAAYFQAVEALLRPVCDARGWQLVTDRPSCVRVRLSADAHIDFALYAIPDTDFELLVEARATAAQTRDEMREAIELADSVYRDLPEDHIMLAHRDEGWKPSDPRKLEVWFRAAIDRHGYQLRRICRFIKAWRDHQWEVCRLSSIALMACVVDTYDRNTGGFNDARDDVAMLTIAARLAQQLEGRIENPVVTEQYLDEAWSDEQRADYVARGRLLHSHIAHAMRVARDAEDALGRLTDSFGTRIPDDADLVEHEGNGIGTPAVLTTGMVRQMADEVAPRQAVQREGDRRYA